MLILIPCERYQAIAAAANVVHRSHRSCIDMAAAWCSYCWGKKARLGNEGGVGSTMLTLASTGRKSSESACDRWGPRH